MALLPVADALARILEHAVPLEAESVALDAAQGRVLAENIKALRTQPPDDVSAMDGYAVRASDIAAVPAELSLIGEIAAGRPFNGTVGAKQAARIFTGGVVPSGADAIAVQENTERNGDRLIVKVSAPQGKHIRRGGIDFKEGDLLLQRGRVLTGRDVSLAAAANHPRLSVARKPKVAIFATGDELVMPGETPAPGQIVYSNGYAVMALARSEGADVIDLGIVPDRMDDTIAAVRRARELGADILVTTGGASVGDYDLIHGALTAEKADLSFWKVALRPGRPLMHGRLGRTHVLGLPGNPVSAFVCGFLFLVPLVRKMTGRADVAHLVESIPLGRDLPANDERADYLRGTLQRTAGGGLAAFPRPVQDSSLMQALANADCLILRAPNAPAARAGELCDVIKLPL